MSRPPTTLGVRHVAFLVTDMRKAEEFYCGVLGYQVEWRPDADNLYLTAAGQDNLALHKGAENKLDHIGIALKRAEDVDAWHAHLKAAGAAILKEPKTHRDGARSFYARDPHGTTIQYIHHPPIVACYTARP
jgi:catechol 2,3-dioxygenase-like lactoylglutathione lyase family enzyme